jgi:tRNA 2-selenouridine synthase
MYRLASITPEQALCATGARFVDTRSESEFALDHLPGAVNVPLFTDDQRAIVGTLFAKKGFLESFRRGEEIVQENLERLVETLSAVTGRDLPESAARRLVVAISDVFREGGDEPRKIEEAPFIDVAEPLVVYCWRGGMRSKAVVLLLGELGVDVVQLKGGYRAYRNLVSRMLAEAPAPRCFVLRGNTGVGKTLILRRIADKHPEAVLDFEKLAQHRSSILGDIGLVPRTKKHFDSLLFVEIYQTPHTAVICEGESRKIGDVEIPATLYASMERGPHVLVEASLDTRRHVLVDEYLKSGTWTPEKFAERLVFLEKRIGRKHASNLLGLFERGDYEAVADVLITRYYDPLYSHTLKKYSYNLTVNADDMGAAAEEIHGFFKTMYQVPTTS